MRLLLAEDERDLSDALVAILTRNNFSVDAVYNGTDAIDYLQTGNYDGAILDIMMPGTDGITVLKTVRRQGNPLPVLILTAKAEVDDRVRGLDSGANDYLTKPFAMKELLARVRAMTRQKKEVDSTLRCGNVTLDRLTYVLWTDKGSEHLANKEFQLMELFMTTDRCITTEGLMEKIWGLDSDSELNSVWSHLTILRRILRRLDADITIKGVRNVGYRLESL